MLTARLSFYEVFMKKKFLCLIFSAVFFTPPTAISETSGSTGVVVQQVETVEKKIEAVKNHCNSDKKNSLECRVAKINAGIPVDETITCTGATKEFLDIVKDKNREKKDDTKEKKEKASSLNDAINKLKQELADIDSNLEKDITSIDAQITEIEKDLAEQEQAFVDQAQEMSAQLQEVMTTKLTAVQSEYSNALDETYNGCRAQATKNAKILYEYIKAQARSKISGEYKAKSINFSTSGQSDLKRVQDMAMSGGSVDGQLLEGYTACVTRLKKQADGKKAAQIQNLKTQEANLKNKIQSAQNKLNLAKTNGTKQVLSKMQEKQNLMQKAQRDKMAKTQELITKNQELNQLATTVSIDNSIYHESELAKWNACCKCPDVQNKTPASCRRGTALEDNKAAAGFCSKGTPKENSSAASSVFQILGLPETNAIGGGLLQGGASQR